MLIIAIIFASICLSVLFFGMFKALNRALQQYEMRFKGETVRNMAEVFLFFDPLQVWSAAVFLCLSGMLIVWIITLNPVISLLFGGVCLILPPFVFSHIKKKRIRRFNDQLPQMLSTLSAALKAGAGVQTALKTVVQESLPPLSQEFGLVLREQRLGLSFEEALNNLAIRMPTEATFLVVSSLKIAAQTGGNLAEALERVANALRAIKQIEGKIEALTSQGKFQAKVMICLPLLLIFALEAVGFKVMDLLLGTTGGWIVLMIILVLESCGAYFIKKIVSIDI